LFLINSSKPVNIKELQEKVWGQMPDLETHTVETHIYRLRKKIKDKFQDNDLIISLKNGYQIV
jgi:DNA-binding response OmpR family regulator